MIGLLVPASDDERGGNAGLNYYPIDTRWLHLAGWFDRVIFSLTGLWRGVQLIISIGSIRRLEHDQTAEKQAHRGSSRPTKTKPRAADTPRAANGNVS